MSVAGGGAQVRRSAPDTSTMPRWVGFLAIGVLAAILLLPHTCESTVLTGRDVDLTVVEGSNGPMAGPGVLPESACVRYNERLDLRGLVALAVALALSALGWGDQRSKAQAHDTRVLPWSTWVLDDFGSN